MNRPYVFCHMMTSIDGKIMGDYMSTPNGEGAAEVFCKLAFGDNPYFKMQAWMCGRVTTDDNFTFYKKPQLDESAAPVPEGDFVARRANMYYISVDAGGVLGWEKDELTYSGTTAHIVELLSEKASNTYKAFLRKLGISYIIAGKDRIDFALALKKLKEEFGIQTLMLGGGGVLNWSFIQQGLCDELSVVVAAAADGSSETPTLFEAKGQENKLNVTFSLHDMRLMDGGSVWLRYKLSY